MLIVLAAAAQAIPAAPASSPSQPPVLFFDEVSYDFGDVPDDVMLEYKFRFTNISPFAVRVTNGGCGAYLPVGLDHDIYWPGESGLAAVIVSPLGRSGPTTWVRSLSIQQVDPVP